MERENFLTLARAIMNIKDEMADLRGDIKERIEAASEEHGVDKKVLRKAISEYIKYEKDKAQYLTESADIDNILNKVISTPNEDKKIEENGDVY